MSDWKLFNNLSEALNYTGILCDGLPMGNGWKPYGTECHPRSGNGRILSLSDSAYLLWNWENDARAVFNPNADKNFTAEEKAKFARLWKEANAERKKAAKQRKKKGSMKAREFLDSHCYPFPRWECHPYLEAKHVGTYDNGCFFYTTAKEFFHYMKGRKADNPDAWVLVFPLTDGREVVSLQFIQDDGKKDFMYGGAISEAYWVGYNTLNRHNEGPLILIAEGVATLLAVVNCHLHKNPKANLLAVAAMNCGNLKKVAESMAERYRGVPITILADNDQNETGINHAKAAKTAIPNCRISMPDFIKDFTTEELAAWRDTHNGKHPTDWNDYYLMRDLI